MRAQKRSCINADGEHLHSAAIALAATFSCGQSSAAEAGKEKAPASPLAGMDS